MLITIKIHSPEYDPQVKQFTKEIEDLIYKTIKESLDLAFELELDIQEHHHYAERIDPEEFVKLLGKGDK